MKLKDKIVLITGSESTGGLGAATARLCVAEGAKVMLHGLDASQCQHMVNELGADNAAYTVGDFTDPSIPEMLVRRTIKHFGGIDCVVNNAATMQRGSLESLSSETLHKVYAINAVAPALIIQAAVKYTRERMRDLSPEQKTGLTVVQIGSNNAYASGINLIEYGMAKAAEMNLTKSLGTDRSLIKDNIRINQLNIGWMISENEQKLMQDVSGFPPDWQDRLPPEVAPTGHLLFPKHVANHVVFYLSDESAPATGLAISLDQQTMMQAISNVTGQGLFKSPEYHRKRRNEEISGSEYVNDGQHGKKIRQSFNRRVTEE